MEVKTKVDDQEIQDIITYKPERVKVLSDQEIIKTLQDPNHWPIMKALRKGPMTVRELEDAYGKHASEDAEIEVKSEKTIYRYLKVLKKAGLVAPAGQRVIMGKTATETLFARTAEMFFLRGKTTDYRRDKHGKINAEAIALSLSVLYGNREADLKCLQEFLSSFDKEEHEATVRLMETADDRTLDYLAQVPWKKKDWVLGRISMLSLVLNSPEVFEKLRKCFK